MKSWIWALLIAVTLSLPFAACGKRGDLEPPAGADKSFPRQYPTSK